jgi:hypothetical protein
MGNLWRFSMAVLAAATFGGLTQASVVVPLTLEEMTDKADSILVGKCSSVRSFWKDRKIWTDATFKVDRRMKGRSAGEIVVRQLGGSVTEPAPVAMRIAGGVEFGVGETSLLFTKRRKDGAETVLGLSQGRVPLERDPKSGRWRSRDGQLLDNLLSRIDARLKGRAKR